MSSDAISLLNRFTTSNRTPGLQYLLIQDGKIEFAHVAGTANFETNQPLAGDTIFNACSVTKTFTSVAVMQLAAKDKIIIDENAAAYSTFIPWEKNVTARHLLSHTSGIANPIPLKWVYLQEEPFDESLFLRTIGDRYLKFGASPGKKFAYSNINYLLLGNIIENVSGMHYTDYIERNIISKLDLHKTTLAFTVIDYSKYATAYQKRFSLLNALLGFLIDRKNSWSLLPIISG
jgi:D-alanyl-D-alanine carboxypeptidase